MMMTNQHDDEAVHGTPNTSAVCPVLFCSHHRHTCDKWLTDCGMVCSGYSRVSQIKVLIVDATHVWVSVLYCWPSSFTSTWPSSKQSSHIPS